MRAEFSWSYVNSVMFKNSPALIVVDIGNSRIKLGRFESGRMAASSAPLPEPSITGSVPISDRSGQFDVDRLTAWCSEHVDGTSAWLVASVHRGAAERLIAALTGLTAKLNVEWQIGRITYRDVPLTVHVDQPECVGIDRLLAAYAANRLRQPQRAALVVDLGSAMTVDRVSPSGAFEGGAILPGISMGAHALAEETDALPHVDVTQFEERTGRARQVDRGGDRGRPVLGRRRRDPRTSTTVFRRRNRFARSFHYRRRGG